MGKYIPVEPEKWAEMVKAMAENRLLKADAQVILKHLDEASADCARLKSEVERLRKFNEEAMAHIAKEERKSRERLDMVQAEKERLEQQVKYWRIEAETDHARWLRVLEDVEQLRKAGDAMALSLANADRMEYGDPSEPIEGYMNREVIKAWKAAKEGKQP